MRDRAATHAKVIAGFLHGFVGHGVLIRGLFSVFKKDQKWQRYEYKHSDHAEWDSCSVAEYMVQTFFFPCGIMRDYAATHATVIAGFLHGCVGHEAVILTLFSVFKKDEKWQRYEYKHSDHAAV